MNSYLRKLALPCVLAVLPVLQAASITMTVQGSITAKNIGSSTNAVVFNAVGQTFTYTLNYNDATTAPTFPTSSVYYGDETTGWTASVRIGAYTFAPTDFTHEVAMQEQQFGPSFRDSIRGGSYNTEGTTWTAHGLNFINSSQLFAIFLQDLNGIALPSRHLTDLDAITLSDFTAAKTFGFIAFDPVAGTNVELTGAISSIAFGPTPPPTPPGPTIPEPASFAVLAGLGALGLTASRRRRSLS
jgi:MYXO-CTERM domain-containing protein